MGRQKIEKKEPKANREQQRHTDRQPGRQTDKSGDTLRPRFSGVYFSASSLGDPPSQKTLPVHLGFQYDETDLGSASR